MAKWKEDGNQPGKYWVYDTDGWAYWAEAIQPGEATGLYSVKISLKQQMSDDWYYGINAVAQFATDDDLGDDTEDTGFYEDGLTDDAYYLLMTAAGPSEKVKSLRRIMPIRFAWKHPAIYRENHPRRQGVRPAGG